MSETPTRIWQWNLIPSKKRFSTVKGYVWYVAQLTIFALVLSWVGTLVEGGGVADTLFTVMVGLYGIAAFLGWYFLPTAIAMINQHHNRVAITVLNIVLAWTVVGWVVSLIWSTTTPPVVRMVKET